MPTTLPCPTCSHEVELQRWRYSALHCPHCSIELHEIHTKRSEWIYFGTIFSVFYPLQILLPPLIALLIFSCIIHVASKYILKTERLKPAPACIFSRKKLQFSLWELLHIVIIAGFVVGLLVLPLEDKYHFLIYSAGLFCVLIAVNAFLEHKRQQKCHSDNASSQHTTNSKQVTSP